MKINIIIELNKSQVEGEALIKKLSNALKTGENPLPLLTDKFYILGINHKFCSNDDLSECNISIRNLKELKIILSKENKNLFEFFKTTRKLNHD